VSWLLGSLPVPDVTASKHTKPKRGVTTASVDAYAQCTLMDRQSTCERNVEARSRDHCCRGKAVSIAQSECVSAASAIQHAKRVRRIVLPSVVCPAVPHFSALPHKRYDFREKVTEHKTCVLVFSTASVRNISHSKKNSAIYYHKGPQGCMCSSRYSGQCSVKGEI
jgi:hypothetical protein